MISEEARSKIESSARESRIKWLESVIKESARYERLMVNKDFSDMLSDLDDVVRAHQDQIESLMKQKYESDDPLERQRFDLIIEKHWIRKEQASEFKTRPPKLIEFANAAREELSILKEKYNHAGH